MATSSTTNVVNTAFLVGNGFSSNGQTSMDMLINAYRATRQPEINALTTQQDTLGRKQIFFNSIRSKLEALQNLATNLTTTDAPASFVTRAVSSSDATIASVSATSAAAVGVSNLKVSRLATNDSLLSDRVTTATAFSAELASRGLDSGIATGSKSFSINGHAYTISLSGSETNEDVMNKIVTAVNSDSNSAVAANVVKDTSTTGRLTFTSKSTGSDGAITFTDSSSLLSAFGLGSIKQSTSSTPLSATSSTIAGTDTLGLATGVKNFSVNGVAYSFNYNSGDNNQTVLTNIAEAINSNTNSSVTASVVDKGSGNFALSFTNNVNGGTLNVSDTDGFLSNIGLPSSIQTDVRTNATNTKAGYANNQEANLNSLATVNGITVTRSSNSMTDVLTGVTINLLKPQASTDTPLTLTTTVDADAVVNKLQPLLDAFNEAMRYMQSNNKTMAGNDGTIRGLVSDLRGLSSTVLGDPSADTKYLSDAGLSIGSDGALSIGDKDKLKTALQADPTKISKLFTGSTGLGQKIIDIIGGVTGSTGLAQTRSAALGAQIDTTGKKVKDLQARIDAAVEKQKNDYTKLQQTLYTLQSQASTYSSYNGSSALY